MNLRVPQPIMKLSTNQNIFKVIFKNLSKKGIFILTETLKSYKHQGWMSKVFVVESNHGPLIIHLVNLVREHHLNKVWDKFYGLSKILSSHQNIPTPHILYTELIGKTFVLTQNFSFGIRAGKRILKEDVISDKWEVNKKNILPNILQILAGIHKIQFTGFGWPVLSGSSLKGKYTTWKKFLEYSYPLWLKELHRTDRRLSLKNPLAVSLDKFIKETVEHIDYLGPAVLVHGDAINPGNLLICDKRKLMLVDWEWSIFADPAWEFCDLGWWKLIDINTLSIYFKISNIRKKSEKIDFINRINLYIPLWLLWGAYMHAHDSKPDVYIALRKLLLKRMKN
jgi:thiamine kinase-like enzyme